MKDFFEGIAYVFEEILLVPLDALRELELSSWWAANAINFVFVLIGMAAFIYWMMQLKKFNDNDEENRDPSAHSFLG